MLVMRRFATAVALICASAPSISAASQQPRFRAIKAATDQIARVGFAAKSPVVFEIGRMGLPWRVISDFTRKSGSIEWPAKAGRNYEVWDAPDYAHAQVRYVQGSVGYKPGKSGATAAGVVDALRWVQRKRAAGDSEKLQLAEMRLGIALACLLKIRIGIEAGVKQQLWPQYTLPVKSSFACDTKGVRARLDTISTPDNWKLVSNKKFGPFAASRTPVMNNISVQVPNVSVFYPGNYPVSAWYNVDYAGLKFRAFNAAEASIVQIFEREAWIRTLSDTQVDLHVRLTSLMPIRNVTTESYVPDGWTGEASCKSFDVSNTKEIAYHITRPRGEKRGLRIVGGAFQVGDYSVNKRMITDHSLTLGASVSTTGFSLLRIKGEEAGLVTVFDRQCRRVSATGRMFFDVSDNFPPGEETYLTVDCASSEPTSVEVEYRNQSGNTVSAEKQTIDPSLGWQEHVFVIRNAVFNGGLPNKADFVIKSNGSSLGVDALHISRFRCP